MAEKQGAWEFIFLCAFIYKNYTMGNFKYLHICSNERCFKCEECIRFIAFRALKFNKERRMFDRIYHCKKYALFEPKYDYNNDGNNN